MRLHMRYKQHYVKGKYIMTWALHKGPFGVQRWSLVPEWLRDFIWKLRGWGKP